MRAIPLQAERRPRWPASKRLLALAGDERLVEEIRAGNEAAFEVAFERHGGAVLSFCRHMLGSPEEAEEVVQHTFAAAWSDLQRNRRPVRLKPWLYTVARNRCLSVLRARRETPSELEDAPSTVGMADEVARRSDLRELLADLRELPEEQRAALVLSELDGLSHADVAEVLGRKERDVKAIVFRARSTLIDWREARETPCQEIREQLSVLRGGALRRRTLRHHLQHCAGCSDFRDEVKAQRRMMALVLPVMPSVGLKRSVLAAVGLGGGAAGGGAAVGGVGAGALGFAGGSIAKVAVVAVVAGGGIAAGERALDRNESSSPPPPAAAPGAGSESRSGAVDSSVAGSGPAAEAGRQAVRAGERGQGARGQGRRGKKRHARDRGASGLAPPDTPVRAKGSPPALGRVRRGLAPPDTGPKTSNGRALGHQREAATPAEKPPKLVKDKPKTKPAPTTLVTPLPRGTKQAAGD